MPLLMASVCHCVFSDQRFTQAERAAGRAPRLRIGALHAVRGWRGAGGGEERAANEWLGCDCPIKMSSLLSKVERPSQKQRGSYSKRTHQTTGQQTGKPAAAISPPPPPRVGEEQYMVLFVRAKPPLQGPLQITDICSSFEPNKTRLGGGGLLIHNEGVTGRCV
jgi:hypothetical protein